jgi:hypothetical protein
LKNQKGAIYHKSLFLGCNATSCHIARRVEKLFALHSSAVSNSLADFLSFLVRTTGGHLSRHIKKKSNAFARGATPDRRGFTASLQRMFKRFDVPIETMNTPLQISSLHAIFRSNRGSKQKGQRRHLPGLFSSSNIPVGMRNIPHGRRTA